MQQNPPWELSACFFTELLFLLIPESGDSWKEQTEKRETAFLKKENSIPGTLEFKAKYIKRRRRHGCNFIKKEERKNILGKSIPPYANLSLFLIISSKTTSPTQIF